MSLATDPHRPLRADLGAEPQYANAPSAWSLVMLALASRLVGFVLFQALIALALAAAGQPSPWVASAAWWPVSATLTNLANIALLQRLLRAEGRSYAALLRPVRGSVGRDLLLTLLLTAAAGVLATLPNVGLATLLFGDAQAANELFLRPLPLWAAWASLLLFPATIALAELPTYYGYALPRLSALSGRPHASLLLAATFHSLQHAALPLLFDLRFVVWRALMFLPFALAVGWALQRRPRLLPYLVVVHGLLDLSVAALVLGVSQAGA